MISQLPDGSSLWITREIVEHRATDGTVLASRAPTADDLATIEEWIANLPPARDAAWAEWAADRALDPRRGEIRAARLRLRQIETQGVALAESPAPPTSTAAEVKAAVDGQAVQIRAIARALADLAAIVLELGRVVLRDAE